MSIPMEIMYEIIEGAKQPRLFTALLEDREFKKKIGRPFIFR